MLTFRCRGNRHVAQRALACLVSTRGLAGLLLAVVCTSRGATLDWLEIQGPSDVPENSTADYVLLGHYTDGSVLDRTADGSWSVSQSSFHATAVSIESSWDLHPGRLTTEEVREDTRCRVYCSYGVDATWKYITVIDAQNGLWSGALDLGDGEWSYLSWFGHFVDYGNGWIYHSEHDWMYSTGLTTASIWFWTADMGWLWSSDSTYPYLYRLQDRAWLWYERPTDNPRWLYNLKSGAWEQR